MGENTKENANWSKRFTVEYIKKHLAEYEFPLELRELKGKIKSCKMDEIEECYKSFFEEFDNNIFFRLFDVSFPGCEKKITCKNVNGYFCKIGQYYVPFKECRKNENLWEIQEVSEVLVEKWNIFLDELKGVQKSYQKNSDIINKYCSRKRMLILETIIFIIFVAFIFILAIWVNGKNRLFYLAFLILCGSVIMFIYNVLEKERKRCAISVFAQKFLEIDTSKKLTSNEFYNLLKEKNQKKKEKQRFDFEMVRNYLDELSKQRENRELKLSGNRLNIHASGKKTNKGWAWVISFVVFSIISTQFPQIKLPKVPEGIKTAAIESVLPDNDQYTMLPSYQIVVDGASVYDKPDRYSDLLKTLNKGDEICTLDEKGKNNTEKWYKVSLGDGSSGWINRRELKPKYSNEVSILSGRLTDNDSELPELYDGYIESVWTVPAEVLNQEQAIELTLDSRTVISGIIIYNGNYSGNSYHQYGKVAEIAISLDGNEEIMKEIDTQYDLEGQHIPISGETKKITIRVTKVQSGLSTKQTIRGTICISEIIVLKEEKK